MPLTNDGGYTYSPDDDTSDPFDDRAGSSDPDDGGVPDIDSDNDDDDDDDFNPINPYEPRDEQNTSDPEPDETTETTTDPEAFPELDDADREGTAVVGGPGGNEVVAPSTPSDPTQAGPSIPEPGSNPVQSDPTNNPETTEQNEVSAPTPTNEPEADMSLSVGSMTAAIATAVVVGIIWLIGG
jgi:hypothetical protein